MMENHTFLRKFSKTRQMLQDLSDVLAALPPERFNMAIWHERRASGPCGCALYWLATHYPQTGLRVFGDGRPESVNNILYKDDLGRVHYGYRAAQMLFCGAYQGELARQISNLFDPSCYLASPNDEIPVTAVIERIDELLAKLPS